MQGARGAAVLMCGHGAAHDVRSAQRGESAKQNDPCHERAAQRRAQLIGWAHTALTRVCARCVGGVHDDDAELVMYPRCTK